MKYRILAPIFALFFIIFSGCDTVKNVANNVLTEQNAIAGIKELLSVGAKGKAIISQDLLMNAILPKEVSGVLQKLQQLGLSSEVDRFTNTLSNAATQTAAQSVPIFLNGISRMAIRDAIGIVKNGGTSATDYLRNTIGSDLKNTVTPIMRNALNEYKIADEWDKLIGPAKIVLGSKANLNLNLDNLLAGIVTNAMFNKIAAEEINIRTKAEARTTPLLQQVFGKTW